MLKKIFFEQVLILLKILQAFTAKTVMITLFKPCFELRLRRYTKTLTLGYITRLTFKRLVASWTVFRFMPVHDSAFYQNEKSIPP